MDNEKPEPFSTWSGRFAALDYNERSQIMKHKAVTATGKTTTRTLTFSAIGSILIGSLLLVGVSACSSNDAPNPSPSPSASSTQFPFSGSGSVDGLTTVPTPAVVASPAPAVVVPEPVASLAGLLSVPSLSVSAKLLTMPITDGAINPPTHSDAYIIEGTGWGTPGNTDGLTSAIAYHSGRGVEALGNSFINVETGKSTLNEGDSLSADGYSYKVQKVLYVLKGDLPTTDEVFETVPGRLLLITCLARPTGKSLNNVIVIAQQQ